MKFTLRLPTRSQRTRGAAQRRRTSDKRASSGTRVDVGTVCNFFFSNDVRYKTRFKISIKNVFVAVTALCVRTRHSFLITQYYATLAPRHLPAGFVTESALARRCQRAAPPLPSPLHARCLRVRGLIFI